MLVTKSENLKNKDSPVPVFMELLSVTVLTFFWFVSLWYLVQWENINTQIYSIVSEVQSMVSDSEIVQQQASINCTCIVRVVQ